MIPKKAAALDHETPEEIDKPRSLEEFVDYVSEQSFPGSDSPPYYAGGCAAKEFAEAEAPS